MAQPILWTTNHPFSDHNIVNFGLLLHYQIWTLFVAFWTEDYPIENPFCGLGLETLIQLHGHPESTLVSNHHFYPNQIWTLFVAFGWRHFARRPLDWHATTMRTTLTYFANPSRGSALRRISGCMDNWTSRINIGLLPSFPSKSGHSTIDTIHHSIEVPRPNGLATTCSTVENPSMVWSLTTTYFRTTEISDSRF